MIKKRKGLFAGKEAQLQISFEMIFTMLIIAVFLVVVFFVIQHFLEVKRCADIGLFSRQLQESVDEVWKSQEASTFFEREMPSGLEYACFADLKQGLNLESVDSSRRGGISGVYESLSAYFKYRSANFFLYPWKNACSMAASDIKHISLAGKSNPLCFSEDGGMVKIRLVKGFNDALVRIGS